MNQLRILGIVGVGIILSGCNIFQSDPGDTSIVSGQNDPVMVLAKTAAEPTGTECIEPPEGLIGFWPGDGTPEDYSGNYNHGVLVGNATFSEGYVEQAFRTDPIGDYVDITNSPEYDTLNGFTLSAWIFVAENTYYPAILNKGNVETADESFSLFLDPWGKLGLLVNSNGTTSGRTMFVGPQMTHNEWYFVTATYDGLWMKLFVDGAYIGQKVHFGGIHAGSHKIILGVMEKNPDMVTLPSLSGNIDETSIYNRALADEEILALYNAGHYGKCKDPAKVSPPVELIPEEIINEAVLIIEAAKADRNLARETYEAELLTIDAALQEALAAADLESDPVLREQMIADANAQAALQEDAALDVFNTAQDESKEVIQEAKSDMQDAWKVIHSSLNSAVNDTTKTNNGKADGKKK